MCVLPIAPVLDGSNSVPHCFVSHALVGKHSVKAEPKGGLGVIPAFVINYIWGNPNRCSFPITRDGPLNAGRVGSRGAAWGRAASSRVSRPGLWGRASLVDAALFRSRPTFGPRGPSGAPLRAALLVSHQRASAAALPESPPASPLTLLQLRIVPHSWRGFYGEISAQPVGGIRLWAAASCVCSPRPWERSLRISPSKTFLKSRGEGSRWAAGREGLPCGAG